MFAYEHNIRVFGIYVPIFSELDFFKNTKNYK